MKKYVDEIISRTNYDISCHGLQAFAAANEIAKGYFAIENIPFDGWKVREIPVADDSGEYPVAVVLCVCNDTVKKEISLNITRDGKLFNVNPDMLCEIDTLTILEAINHESSKF
jgi:hypothetical protein